MVLSHTFTGLNILIQECYSKSVWCLPVVVSIRSRTPILFLWSSFSMTSCIRVLSLRTSFFGMPTLATMWHPLTSLENASAIGYMTLNASVVSVLVSGSNLNRTCPQTLWYYVNKIVLLFWPLCTLNRWHRLFQLKFCWSFPSRTSHL